MKIKFLEDCEIEVMVGYFNGHTDFPLYDEVDIESGDIFDVEVIKKKKKTTKVQFLHTGDVAFLDNTLFKKVKKNK